MGNRFRRRRQEDLRGTPRQIVDAGTPPVSQMVFPNVEEAQAAREPHRLGLSFDDLAKERGLNPSDIDLGTIAKSAIIDPAIADAAFSLAPAT